MSGASAGNGGVSGAAMSGAAGQAGSGLLDSLDSTSGRVGVADQDACVVSGGQVFCWGYDLLGQLGITPPPFGTPGPAGIVEVPGLTDIAGVAMATDHSCAVTTNGDVYCWGGNEAAQVGSASAPMLTCADDIDLPCQPTPTRVADIARAVELDVEPQVSCARLDDGSVRCWGATADLDAWLGTLGSVTSFSLGARISNGPLRACATVTGGALSCNFELPAEAQAFRGLRRVKLETGDNSSFTTAFGCVLDADDHVACFGDGSLGQLGDATGTLATVLPASVAQFSVGNAHACALLADGRVECWGDNSGSAVGGFPLESPTCGSSTCETAPHLVTGLPPLVGLVARGARMCGFAADATLWCWGSDPATHQASNSGAPQRVPGPWETGGNACSSLLGRIGPRFFTSESCTTDEDCTPLPVDLPCDHTCDVAPVAKANLADHQANLDDLRSKCSAVTDAGCSSPTVTCPAKNLRPICSVGQCTFDDPVRTGCTDECLCDVERRNASQTYFSPICDGFDLWFTNAVTCAKCAGSWVYIVVGNRGSSPFDGEATLSFQGADGVTLPPPQTLNLHLGPGAISDPIRVDSTTGDYVTMSVTAPGDCLTYGEDLTWDFPSPSNTCQ
jgi:hypothetical protein